MNATRIAAAVSVLALLLAQEKSGGATPQPPAAPAAEDAEKPYTVGSVVDSALPLFDLDGKQHSLKEYAGKVIVIDFWSIDCPFSRCYEPRLRALHAEFTKKGVVFLVVNANSTELSPGEDPYLKIKEHVKKASTPYTVLVDRKNVVADRFGAQTTPHLFMLDDQFKLRYVGGLDDDPELVKNDKTMKSYARDAIEALLAGKDPPRTKTETHGCLIQRDTSRRAPTNR